MNRTVFHILRLDPQNPLQRKGREDPISFPTAHRIHDLVQIEAICENIHIEREPIEEKSHLTFCSQIVAADTEV